MQHRKQTLSHPNNSHHYQNCKSAIDATRVFELRMPLNSHSATGAIQTNRYNTTDKNKLCLNRSGTGRYIF
jgi:hypothetical protein